MTRPPIANAVIGVVNHRVVFVGDEMPTNRPPSLPGDGSRNDTVPEDVHRVVDLGEVAVMPALINAHVHLEFSDRSEPLGDPGMRLSDWIGLAVRERSQSDPSERTEATIRGIAESVAAGVGGLADIGSPGAMDSDETGFAQHTQQLVRMIRTLPLRVHQLSEVIGLDHRRWRSTLDLARKLRCDVLNDPAVTLGVDARDLDAAVLRIGLSPHSPYSLSRSGLDAALKHAKQFDQLIAMHVAESPEERELLQTGGGPFADALRSLGIDVDPHFPWPVTDPLVELIQQLSSVPRALLIHGNDLQTHEIETLAEHSQLSVVYCPRTHAFFGHDPHPIDRLWQRGVRVALGTDSRASNPDLNLWSELKHVWTHRTDLDPLRVLKAATLHGADALGWHDRGRIEVGCAADLIAVPVSTDRPDPSSTDRPDPSSTDRPDRVLADRPDPISTDRPDRWIEAWLETDHPVFLPHCKPSGE